MTAGGCEGLSDASGQVGPPLDLQQVTLAILAGGAGKRMGMPKQLLQIARKPMLHYLLDRLSWPGPTLLITTPGRENPPGADRFDAEAIDAVRDQGPLQGVLTAVQSARTSYLIVTTVDMPVFLSHQLAWIFHQLAQRTALAGLMLQHRVGMQQQIEPFPFALQREFPANAPHAARRLTSDLIWGHLNAGRRSVHSLNVFAEFAVADAPVEWDSLCWTNLNKPEDVAAFQASASEW